MKATKVNYSIDVNNYDLMLCYKGNGITVCNKKQEVNGDYKNIAHIDEQKNITWYVKNMPKSIVEQICDEALK